jgi:hypothetical protein
VVTGVAYSSAALGDRVATADLTVRSCLQLSCQSMRHTLAFELAALQTSQWHYYIL